jgi:tRNA pseudouridine13 synthase
MAVSGAAEAASPAPPSPPPPSPPGPQGLLLPAEGRPSGVIKERAEDFLVEELPLYDPCGEGEHLYLGLQRRHMAHSEMLRRLQRHFGVSESAIGAAGMKDRIAVVQQTVSVHLPGREPPPLDLGTDRLGVLWAVRHANKLRRGHLAGNRFVIRIRRIDPLAAPSIWRRLQELTRRGTPNYFGLQRFGYRLNNHRLGAMLLRQEWRGIVEELLGSRGSPFPQHQQARREAFDAGRIAEAAEAWGPNDHCERVAARKLLKSDDPRRAVLSVGEHVRSFWISALQSAIYNALLDARLESGSIDRLEIGDVAMRHEGGACFLVKAEDLADPATADRLARGEISPTGPLWGAAMLAAAGVPGERERAALALLGIDPDRLGEYRFGVDGSRRPYRIFPANPELEGGVDEHGRYVKVAFDLPKGAFATVVLRELIDEQPAEPREPASPGTLSGEAEAETE